MLICVGYANLIVYNVVIKLIVKFVSMVCGLLMAIVHLIVRLVLPDRLHKLHLAYIIE